LFIRSLLDVNTKSTLIGCFGGRILTNLKENDGAKVGGNGAFVDIAAALRTPLASLGDLIWLNTAARRMAHGGG